MATNFGKEYKCSSFECVVGDIIFTGELKVNNDNQIESLNGVFNKNDEMVASVNSFLEESVKGGAKELKFNYNGVLADCHDEIFAVAKATLNDVKSKYSK